MRFLIDGSRSRVEHRARVWSDGVEGQLLTPLTGYANAGLSFAVDNGSFTTFNCKKYLALLRRSIPHRHRCLFVTAPDVVSDCVATRELWSMWFPFLHERWPVAFVGQDGCERIPANASWLFVGGSTDWKDSRYASRLVEKALRHGCRVHVGRVNTIRRYLHFRDLGAHTCDGSGVSRFDSMWCALARAVEQVR